MTKTVNWNVVKRLPTDYDHYGGTVVRWEKSNEDYPDCSCGCRWFIPLQGKQGADWGVCNKVDSPRAGMLTFEHQAGYQCFEGSRRNK